MTDDNPTELLAELGFVGFDSFVNLWGNSWVRASEVVSVTAGLDIIEDPLGGELPCVYVRMRDGLVHSNIFGDPLMKVDEFIKALVRQLAGEHGEDEG